MYFLEDSRILAQFGFYSKETRESTFVSRFAAVYVLVSQRAELYVTAVVEGKTAFTISLCWLVGIGHIT